MKPEDRKQNQELWQERIKDWQQSGLSASAWCEQHNLKPHLFFYWKRKLLTEPESKLIPLGKISREPARPDPLALYIDAIRIE